MSTFRYFSPHPLEEDALLTLSGEESHHLKRVMRQKVGEPVEIVNGRGDLALGKILQMDSPNVQIALSTLSHSPPPLSPLTLIQALPKKTSLEWIVQKSTELGIDTLLLFPAQKSERSSLSKTEKERIDKILIGALKQSKRLYLPKWQLIDPLSSATFIPTSHHWFGDLTSTRSLLKENWADLHKTKKAHSLYIGPEGGWSTDELILLKTHAQGICLSQHVLRAETAAITSLALLKECLRVHAP